MKHLLVNGLVLLVVSCSVSPERPATFHGTSDAQSEVPTESNEQPTAGDDSGAAKLPTTVPPVGSLPSNPSPVPAANPTLPSPMPPSIPPASTGKDIKKVNILVFSKTAGFRHDDSIKNGLALIKKLSEKNGFAYEATEDSSKMAKEYLAKFDAVFFLCTTGDIFNAEQQTVFENYIKSGGGYFGVHSATDTEYDWPWYGKLVGGFFDGHEVYDSTLTRNDKTHVSTSFLPDAWKVKDEWYRFKSFNNDVKVLLTMDDSANTNPNVPHTSHPIAWYHEYEGGRAWYSGMGHFDFVWTNPLFERHVYGGLLYAAGVTNVTP